MTAHLLWLLFLLCALAPCGQARAQEVHIGLKPETVLNTRHYALADIADIAGGTAAQRAQVGAIALGMAPRPGSIARWSATQLQRLVHARLPYLAPVWEGAPQASIGRAGQPYGGRLLQDSAAAFLRRILAGAAPQPELQVLQPVADLLLPPGQVSVQPRALLLEQALRRQVNVWLDISVDGVHEQAVVVRLGVRAPQAALVARHDLSKGQVPSCADFSVREVDLGEVGALPAAAPCVQLAGRLRHALGAGAILLAAALEAVPAVAQGELVSLQTDAGGVRLEVPAVALSDGALGQTIAVRARTSDANLLAQVVSAGTVKLIGR